MGEITWRSLLIVTVRSRLRGLARSVPARHGHPAASLDCAPCSTLQWPDRMSGAAAPTVLLDPPGEPGAPAADAGAPSIVHAGERRSRRIESLRAVAALGVLVGHAFLTAMAYRSTSSGWARQIVSGGLLAVFLFFTLSGYLLFWPWVRRHFDGGPSISLGRYARNRALRVLPLYFVTVAVLLWLAPLGAHRSDWWRFALLLENFSPRTAERLDSAMWSLVVEIQFYLVLPFLAAAIMRIGRGSIGRALALVGLLAGGSFALRLHWLLLHGPVSLDPLRGPLSLPTLFFFFCGGMAVALLRVAWTRRPPAWLHGRLGSPDAWLLASVPAWVIAAHDNRLEPLILLAAFLVVGGCVLAPGGGVLVQALEWRPLAAIGLASYSLYLWHVPLLTALSHARIVYTPNPVDLAAPQSFPALLALGLPVCLVVAGLSYVLVESPFLRLRRRWA